MTLGRASQQGWANWPIPVARPGAFLTVPEMQKVEMQAWCPDVTVESA